MATEQTLQSNDAALDLGPLRRSVVVECGVDEAFEIFTTRIGSWWPLQTHSVSQDRARTCAIEPCLGGDVYEVRDDGERFSWGKVLAWEPPHRLMLSWHPGRSEETSQQVEVTFQATDAGTTVQVEHRDWHKLGADATDTRTAYGNGWQALLDSNFAVACRGA